MYLPLSHAPYDTPVTFESILDQTISDRFQGLGISKGDTITKLKEKADACPVRIRTNHGEVLLAPGMASKIIAHHDDGHKTPISEMEPGETGHVEGLVCGTALEQGLLKMGIKENDSIEMVRQIPPMDYDVMMDGKRIVLHEGGATKIWGQAMGKDMQFAVVGQGEPFTVKALLGGQHSKAVLEAMGIKEGSVLTLQSVRPASSSGCGITDQTVLVTKSGLRMYIRKDLEKKVMVSV